MNLALTEKQEGDYRVQKYPEMKGAESVTIGRLLGIHVPNLGEAYFIDVTDSDDPTTEDPADPESLPEKVKDLMRITFNARREGWHFNSGVVVLVSGRYSGEPRAYVGLQKTDPADPERKDITTHVLDKVGYKQISSYVPMSFDGGDFARETLNKELERAVKEIQERGWSQRVSDWPLLTGPTE